jgi:tRNA(fMet)-specific endonuclease VapC
MQDILVDTDIVSYYFKGYDKVIKKFEEYLENNETINISIITYYEILSGLKFKGAKKQLKLFQEFANDCNILPLTNKSIEFSSELYAKLRKDGTPVDDIDLLIAGIALEHDLILITNNEKHFSKIKKLKIENWSK